MEVIEVLQHGGEPETVEKLRWLLAKAVCAFGDRRINHLQPAEIAAWRMTIPSGHRSRRLKRYGRCSLARSPASLGPVPDRVDSTGVTP